MGDGPADRHQWLRRYVGEAHLYGENDELLGTVNLAAVDWGNSSGVLPVWDGQALLGRPAWGGAAKHPTIDWVALVRAQRPVTIIIEDRRSEALVVDYDYEFDRMGKLQGGPPPPF
jgi:hypothetical protein